MHVTTMRSTSWPHSEAIEDLGAQRIQRTRRRMLLRPRRRERRQATAGRWSSGQLRRNRGAGAGWLRSGWGNGPNDPCQFFPYDALDLNVIRASLSEFLPTAMPINADCVSWQWHESACGRTRTLTSRIRLDTCARSSLLV